MNKRYSIMVVEYADEYELCQCDSAPEKIAEAASRKKKQITTDSGRRRSIPKYFGVRIRDNQVAS